MPPLSRPVRIASLPSTRPLRGATRLALYAPTPAGQKRAADLSSAFRATERSRAQTLTGLRGTIAARERDVGLTDLHDVRLASLRLHQMHETYRFDRELLITLTESVVAQAQEALAEHGLSDHMEHAVPSKKLVAAKLESGLVLKTLERSKRSGSLLVEFHEALQQLRTIYQAAQEKEELASGPALNRGQKVLLDTARSFVDAANTKLPAHAHVPLPSIFQGPIAPYTNSVPDKPGALAWYWRGSLCVLAMHRGAIENRAMHYILSDGKIPLFLDYSQLPAGVKPTRQHWYRRHVDRSAKALAERAMKRGDYGSRSDLLQFLAFKDDPKSFLSQLRKHAGHIVNSAAGLSVSFEFAPGAREMYDALARDLGADAPILFVPTHTGTSDQMIFLEGMPDSDLDRMFGGNPGRAIIVARPDYDKDIPLINLLHVAPDQERLYGVQLIDESDRRAALRDTLGLAERMKTERVSALLFAVGGRNRFLHSHNPLEPNGFSVLASRAQILAPLSIRNSTGEELRGGKARIIAGRPMRISDLGVKEGRIPQLERLETALAYTWHEQGRHLFTWDE